jgi:hypothetical protein
MGHGAWGMGHRIFLGAVAIEAFALHWYESSELCRHPERLIKLPQSEKTPEMD